MTPKFKEMMQGALEEWRDRGVTPELALRNTEIACGKHNEEFSGHGTALVEKVYDGKFSLQKGGAGVVFTPNAKPKQETAAAAPAAAPEEAQNQAKPKRTRKTG